MDGGVLDRGRGRMPEVGTQTPVVWCPETLDRDELNIATQERAGICTGYSVRGTVPS